LWGRLCSQISLQVAGWPTPPSVKRCRLPSRAILRRSRISAPSSLRPHHSPRHLLPPSCSRSQHFRLHAIAESSHKIPRKAIVHGAGRAHWQSRGRWARPRPCLLPVSPGYQTPEILRRPLSLWGAGLVISLDKIVQWDGTDWAQRGNVGQDPDMGGASKHFSFGRHRFLILGTPDEGCFNTRRWLQQMRDLVGSRLKHCTGMLCQWHNWKRALETRHPPPGRWIAPRTVFDPYRLLPLALLPSRPIGRVMGVGLVSSSPSRTPVPHQMGRAFCQHRNIYKQGVIDDTVHYPATTLPGGRRGRNQRSRHREKRRRGCGLSTASLTGRSPDQHLRPLQQVSSRSRVSVPSVPLP
jgi:hypothetical protein